MEEKISLLILAEANDPFSGRLAQWLRARCPFVRLFSGGEAKPPTAIVLSPHLKEPPCTAPGGEAYLIFRSDSAPAAQFAAAGQYRLLDYGFSLRDSLTFSGVSEKQAAIALQRPLLLPTGELLEPMEFPVALCGTPDTDVLLCAAAVCLLASRMESLASFP